jgi:hypothetical protein
MDSQPSVLDSEEAIIKEISYNFTILKVEKEKGILTFKIQEKEYDKEKFQHIYYKLRDFGYYSYTNGKGEIVVLNKSKPRNKNRVKIILLVLTFLSILYAGFTYSSGYYGDTSTFTILIFAILFFALPVSVILFFRELPKFLIRRVRNQSYSLPIFVPNPFLMGTMGTINAPNEPFLNSDDEILSGFSSLILGFIVSAFFLIMGYSGISIYGGSDYVVNGSNNLINIPLLIQIISGHIIPSEGILDPMALAGWVGLIFTSFNSFPISFLDGGLILSGFDRNIRKNISYIGITIMIFICFTYASWLILPLFLALLGMGTLEPIDSNFLRTNRKALMAIGIVMALVIVGLAPFPVHINNPEAQVFYNGEWAVSMNGSQPLASFNVVIRNVGQIELDPGFALNRSMKFDVSTTHSMVMPGTANSFRVTINTTGSNYGKNSVNLNIYAGSVQKTIPLIFVELGNSTGVKVNDSNFVHIVTSSSKNINITVTNTENRSVYEYVMIASPINFNYNITVTNSAKKTLTFSDTGSKTLPEFKISSPGNSRSSHITINLSMEPTYTENIFMAIYNSTYYGDLILIN